MRQPLAMLLLLSLACAAFTARAEDQTQDEKEKEEAKAEDEAESKMVESARVPVLISGTLTMVACEESKIPDVVVGQMTVKGMAYQLKVADAGMLKRLNRYDGKMITLSGKTRNKGKYFIVGSVIEAAPAPVERKKRGGM